MADITSNDLKNDLALKTFIRLLAEGYTIKITDAKADNGTRRGHYYNVQKGLAVGTWFVGEDRTNKMLIVEKVG